MGQARRARLHPIAVRSGRPGRRWARAGWTRGMFGAKAPETLDHQGEVPMYPHDIARESYFREWRRFVEIGECDAKIIRPIILESWKRCRGPEPERLHERQRLLHHGPGAPGRHPAGQRPAHLPGQALHGHPGQGHRRDPVHRAFGQQGGLRPARRGATRPCWNPRTRASSAAGPSGTNTTRALPASPCRSSPNSPCRSSAPSTTAPSTTTGPAPRPPSATNPRRLSVS